MITELPPDESSVALARRLAGEGHWIRGEILEGLTLDDVTALKFGGAAALGLTAPEATATGAGAWADPSYYHRAMARPYESRVALAVRSVKAELRQQGYGTLITRRNDVYGRGAAIAVARFQRDHHLLEDGRFGRVTSMALFVPVVRRRQVDLSIPEDILACMIYTESLFDPGAEGRLDPRDRGLCQWNRRWHPEIPDEIAYGDARESIRLAARALRSAHDGLLDDAGGNDPLAWTCAIAHHNNPSKAIAWARSGQPPDDQIEQYVRVVRGARARLPA